MVLHSRDDAGISLHGSLLSFLYAVDEISEFEVDADDWILQGLLDAGIFETWQESVDGLFHTSQVIQRGERCIGRTLHPSFDLGIFHFVGGIWRICVRSPDCNGCFFVPLASQRAV
jgi:hypothetical protein